MLYVGLTTSTSFVTYLPCTKTDNQLDNVWAWVSCKVMFHLLHNYHSFMFCTTQLFYNTWRPCGIQDKIFVGVSDHKNSSFWHLGLFLADFLSDWLFCLQLCSSVLFVCCLILQPLQCRLPTSASDYLLSVVFRLLYRPWDQRPSCPNGVWTGQIEQYRSLQCIGFLIFPGC